jgi:hypothetical protein
VTSGIFYSVLQNRPNSRIGPPGQLLNNLQRTRALIAGLRTRGPTQPIHSATAGYPARSSKMLDFDGKSARMGMTSCLITVISPSDTVGHIASYGIPNATMRRFRNRSQNGAERRQPRWRLIEYSPILLVRVVRKIGKCSWVYKKVIHVFHIHLPIFL